MENLNNKSDSAVSSRKKRKSGFWESLKHTSFGESRSYLFEYGLLLLLTGALLYVLIAMVQLLYASFYTSLPVFTEVQNTDVLLLSALTVLLPLVIILIQRTAETERSNPSVKNLAWRKIFLGVFLSVVSVWAVVTSILFVNSILEYLSNSLMVSGDFEWRSALTYFITASLLLITAWTFGNDYRYVVRDHFLGLRRFYRYGLVIIALVIGLVFLLFPFRENRTAYIDQQIISDLHAISSLVDTYSVEHNRMPLALTDLNLSEGQLSRANSYNYSLEIRSGNNYGLCAVFNTNAVDPVSESQRVIPDLSAHTSGLNCFDFSVAGFQPDSTSDLVNEVDLSNASEPVAPGADEEIVADPGEVE